jgi:uncharacterized damage-inducible protein DinB
VPILRSIVQTVLLRELAALRREVEAYPDDESLWRCPPGLPNAGGTLALHLAGNLQHYVGALLGQSGYRRDRPAEFARRGVSRGEILAEIEAARAAVERTLPKVPDASLVAPFPEQVGGRTMSTSVWLVHLATHLAYHLGQLDYHRRVVTGDSKSVGALPMAELPAWEPGAADSARR